MKKVVFLSVLFVVVFMFLLLFACGQFRQVPVNPTSIPDVNTDSSVISIVSQDLEEVTQDTVMDNTTNYPAHNPYSYYYSTLSDSLLLHVGSGIPYDSDSSDDFLIFRSQYAISYNPRKGVPNWASWYLDSTWFGPVSRFKGNFLTDFSLPDSVYKVTHKYYTNTGFDRGHLVQSHQRTRNYEDNKSTFYMTNVFPQTPDLNRGVSLKFENFCETLCKDSGYRLFIIAGGVYHQNLTLKDSGLVAIPDSCYKIVLVTSNVNKTIDSTAHVYAVMMPNIDGVRNDDWKQYQTTVKQIENSTGYNFFDRLSTELQSFLEGE
ncbi:MAG: DNA/RNA non-specific endonuclease [Bacteroidia bacterium]|nr:DNA/RNA non-specific endonuclease [Bacteroidia bacterium]